MSGVAAGRPATATRTIEEVLAEARSRLERVSPYEAANAAGRGAVLVDIRPERQRAAEGEIPGALVVERNVLEWRFDPTSNARLSIASYELEIIVVCSEGYTSSLAAASLQDLGIRRASDLDGGFRAWRAAGLPTRPGPGRASREHHVGGGERDGGDAQRHAGARDGMHGEETSPSPPSGTSTSPPACSRPVASRVMQHRRPARLGDVAE